MRISGSIIQLLPDGTYRKHMIQDADSVNETLELKAANEVLRSLIHRAFKLLSCSHSSGAWPKGRSDWNRERDRWNLEAGNAVKEGRKPEDYQFEHQRDES
jgi:hypothetical protein